MTTYHNDRYHHICNCLPCRCRCRWRWRFRYDWKLWLRTEALLKSKSENATRCVLGGFFPSLRLGPMHSLALLLPLVPYLPHSPPTNPSVCHLQLMCYSWGAFHGVIWVFQIFWQMFLSINRMKAWKMSIKETTTALKRDRKTDRQLEINELECVVCVCDVIRCEKIINTSENKLSGRRACHTHLNTSHTRYTLTHAHSHTHTQRLTKQKELACFTDFSL